MRPRAPLLVLALALAVLGTGGCATFGPERIALDRSAYVDHLRDSEKAQLLSNIVALQADDAPVFLNVTSLINQYTRERSGRITVNPWQDDNESGLGGSLLLRETPTVTYTPMAGDRLAKSLLAPIPPSTLVSLIEAGWPADVLLALTARSINGVRNGGRGGLFAQTGDPGFAESLGAMRRLQSGGALTVRVTEHDKAFVARAQIRAELSPADQADLALLRQTLGLGPGGGDLNIVFAPAPSGPNELAIATRSMLEVMLELGAGVTPDGQPPDPLAAMTIATGAKAPVGAYASVRRGQTWFWIAADDQRSRRAFLITQILMSLNDALAAGQPPLIALPAG